MNIILGKAGTPFVGYLPTKGVPAWCGLALQANLLHVMLEGKLNMESILILLLKRRPAYNLQKLIFGYQEAAADKLEQSFKCLSETMVCLAHYKYSK